MTTGFDDAGARVALTQADAGLVCPHCRRLYEDEAPDAAATRQRALREVLEFLASENDLRKIGWRVALMHWLVTRGESQTQLAARLGVSKGAITQSLNTFREQITQCLKDNGERGGLRH